MHIKVIRTFVEAVLRYGLPVDYTTVITRYARTCGERDGDEYVCVCVYGCVASIGRCMHACIQGGGSLLAGFLSTTPHHRHNTVRTRIISLTAL